MTCGSSWSVSVTSRWTPGCSRARARVTRGHEQRRAPSGVDTVSVYAEMSNAQVVVHVRDRGAGFEVESIPDDRMGVRESIVGRMERHGGRATGHQRHRHRHSYRARHAQGDEP